MAALLREQGMHRSTPKPTPGACPGGWSRTIPISSCSTCTCHTSTATRAHPDPALRGRQLPPGPRPDRRHDDRGPRSGTRPGRAGLSDQARRRRRSHPAHRQSAADPPAARRVAADRRPCTARAWPALDRPRRTPRRTDAVLRGRQHHAGLPAGGRRPHPADRRARGPVTLPRRAARSARSSGSPTPSPSASAPSSNGWPR